MSRRRRQFGDVGQGWAARALDAMAAPLRAFPQTSFAVYSGQWQVHVDRSPPTGAGSFAAMTKAQLQEAAAQLLVDVLKQVGGSASRVEVRAVADNGEVVASAGVA